MHVTVRAKDLARILSTVRPAIPARTTIPILSMVLLTARDGELVAAGCSLDTMASDTTSAAIVSPGAAAFPADALTAMVKSLPAESDVTIQPTPDDPRMTIAAGRSRTRLSVLPADDFPTFDAATSFSGTLPADVVRRILVDPLFANAVDDTRYYMRGVHLAAIKGRLQATASDGHRAFRVTTELPPGLADMPTVTVPRDAQGAIAKILDGADGDIAIGISTSRLAITAGSRRFATKLVDGTYPDLDRVIPPLARKHSADLKREDLRAALARVLAIMDDKMPLVAIAFAEGELRLRAVGQNNDSVDAVDAEVSGGAIEIGVNGRYLLDHLGTMSAATVALENENTNDAWRLIDGESGDIHVIMPMRVNR